MKLFSFKALALAFVVATGSAQAGIIDTVLKKADVKLFGKRGLRHNMQTKETREAIIGGLPILRSYLRFENGYARAAVIAALATGISTAAYKTYKHFTNPAADATEEGEIVEANETTTKVAQLSVNVTL